MKVFILSFAILAICSADRLDRNYLPPAGANTAGGSDGALSAPPGSSRTGHRRPPATGLHSQAFRPQQQSSRHQSSSFGPNSESNAFNEGPNSNFGPSNENYQPNNNVPNPRYPSNDRTGFSQQSAFKLRPNTANNNNAGNFDSTNPNYSSGNRNPNANYQARSQRPHSSQEADAAIIRSDSNVDGDGFSYSFETENGISADESGVAADGVQAQGSFSYTGDDGQFYSITYTADENGYRPVGDHLPTPPPIPDAILRSIEENARAAAANPGANYDEYDNSNGDQSGNGFPIGSQNRQPARVFSGAPNRRTQQNLPNNQGYDGGRPSSSNNDQYNAPTGSRPGSQSGFPGSRPQTYPNQSTPQSSRNQNLNGAPGFGGNEAPHSGGRPSTQGVGGSAGDQFAPRRPSASFSSSSGYKY